MWGIKIFAIDGDPNSQSSTQFARTMKKAFAEIEATGYITNIQMKTAKARRIGTPIERVTLTYEIHNPLDEEGNWEAKRDSKRRLITNWSPSPIQKPVSQCLLKWSTNRKLWRFVSVVVTK